MNLLEKLKATWDLNDVNYSKTEGDAHDIKFYMLGTLFYFITLMWNLFQSFQITTYGICFITGITLIWCWYEIIKLNQLTFNKIWKEDEKVD